MSLPSFPDPLKPRRNGSAFLYANPSGNAPETGYYEGFIDEEKLIVALVNKMKEIDPSNGELKDFYYKDYLSNRYQYYTEKFMRKSAGGEFVHDQISGRTQLDDPILIEDGLLKTSLTEVTTKVNKKVGTIDASAKYKVSINIEKEYTEYFVNFSYIDGTPKNSDDIITTTNTINDNFDVTRSDPGNILALQFKTLNADQFLLMNKKMNNDFPNIEAYITKEFDDVRKTLNIQTISLGDDARLKIYNFFSQAPLFYLRKLDIEELWMGLFHILLYDIATIFYDYSDAMVKLMSTIIGIDGGTAFIYKKFNDLPSSAKSIYSDMDKSQKSLFHNGIEVPRKTVFATMIWFIADDNNQWKDYPSRDKRYIVFDITGDNYVDSNIFYSDSSREVYDLTQHTFIKVRELETIYPSGGGGGRTHEITRRIDKAGPTISLHPLDMVSLYVEGPEGKRQKLIVPAIFVKDIAHHKEWGEIMAFIRAVANIFVVIISLVTLIFGNPGPLLFAISVIDLGLAATDLGVQAFAEEIAVLEGGQEFLDNWEKVYFVGGIVTGLPLLGSLLKGGAKLLFTKVLTSGAIDQIVIMLKYSLKNIKNFPKFVGNDFFIIRNFGEFLGTTAKSMQKLSAEGVMLLRGTEIGSTVESFYLSYRNAIIRSGTLKNIKSEISAILKSGKDDLVRYLDEVADGVASIRRGRYLGQVLEAADIAKIEKFLKRFKVDLQIGQGSGEFTVTGYFTKSGNPVMMKARNAAMFITDGNKWKLVLRENATVYEFFHEFMHFQHAKQLGKKNYFNIGSNFGEATMLREKFVYDKMVEYNQYLSRSEVKHANDYMNTIFEEVFNGFSVDFPKGSFKKGSIEIPFDLSTIPKKRLPINMDKILKLN